MGEWHTQTDSQICCIALLELDIQSTNFPTMIPASNMTKVSTTNILEVKGGSIVVLEARLDSDESTAAATVERCSLKISS